MNYISLYRERQDWKQQMRRIKYDRTKWREYVELMDKVKERTVELKRMASIKPECL